MGNTRKTCKAIIECFKLSESIPLDTVTNGTILAFGSDGLVIDATGTLPTAGVVLAPNTDVEGCEIYSAPCDYVEVQSSSLGLTKAATDIPQGSLVGSDANGQAIVVAAGGIGVACDDVVAGQVLQVVLKGGL